jgi:hypothetical protein
MFGLAKTIGGSTVGAWDLDRYTKKPPTPISAIQAISATPTKQPAMSHGGRLEVGEMLAGAATPLAVGVGGAETARPQASQKRASATSVAPQCSQVRVEFISPPKTIIPSRMLGVFLVFGYC